jgi:hypothetical protein
LHAPQGEPVPVTDDAMMGETKERNREKKRILKKF